MPDLTLMPILYWSAELADRRRHDDSFGPGIVAELGDLGVYYAATDEGWQPLNGLPSDARRLVLGGGEER